MTNGFYTVFISKSGSHIDSELLVETKDFNKYLMAKKWAKSNGYVILKEYHPTTILENPDFIKTIN